MLWRKMELGWQNSSLEGTVLKSHSRCFFIDKDEKNYEAIINTECEREATIGRLKDTAEIMIAHCPSKYSKENNATNYIPSEQYPVESIIFQVGDMMPNNEMCTLSQIETGSLLLLYEKNTPVQILYKSLFTPFTLAFDLIVGIVAIPAAIPTMFNATTD